MREDVFYVLVTFPERGPAHRREILGWTATQRSMLALPARTRFAVDLKEVD